MKNLAFGALVMGFLVACGGGDSNNKIKLPDAGGPDAPGVCNPLTQAGCAAGEKCTWIVDAVMPQYVGHVGCTADGDKDVGAACIFGAAGASGYDDCKKGGVCSAFAWGTQGTPNPVQGTCKKICDQQGGEPMCDAQHVCVTYSRLFSTGDTTPAAAGVCDLACDPLLDNDFDGSNGGLTGSASAKRANTCGTNPNVGCYGNPSGGTPPKTGWSCGGDINNGAAGKGLRHRAQCIDSNGCADGTTIYVNSCNQGYLPLLRESSTVSTAVCVALCKPQTCYSGMCGSNNAARHGAPGDGCRDSDRVNVPGTFQAANGGANDPDGGEHCTHMWLFEINMNMILESPSSNTVGFCYNHEVYRFDYTGDGSGDLPYPNCGLLSLGSGTGSGSDATTRFDAIDFGCVPTTLLPTMANGKRMISDAHLERRKQLDLPRMLYRRTMK